MDMDMQGDASIKLREIHLTAYALGELEEPERAKLEAELKHDEQGLEFVQQVRQSAATLTDELMKESGPGLTEIHRLAIAGHFQEMMGAETDGAAQFEHEVEKRKRFSWMMGMSAAAMLMLAALVGIMYATYQYTTQFLHTDSPLVVMKPKEPVVRLLLSTAAPSPFNRSGAAFADNPFVSVAQYPASSLPTAVSDQAYQDLRTQLAKGRLPVRNQVRIEQLLNAFDYQLIKDESIDKAIGAGGEINPCPWNPDHQLVRVAVHSTAAASASPRRVANADQVIVARQLSIRIEFNPAKVAAFRLIGYENRPAASGPSRKPDNQIKAGYALCALYEIIPVGKTEALDLLSPVEQLRYQTPRRLTEASLGDEWLTVSMRYQGPDVDGDAPPQVSRFALTGGADEAESSADFDFAAAVACYGMILRDSPHKADSSFDRVLELVRQSIEQMPETLELQIAQRREFVSLVEKTRDLRTRVH